MTPERDNSSDVEIRTDFVATLGGVVLGTDVVPKYDESS